MISFAWLRHVRVRKMGDRVVLTASRAFFILVVGRWDYRLKNANRSGGMSVDGDVWHIHHCTFQLVFDHH